MTVRIRMDQRIAGLSAPRLRAFLARVYYRDLELDAAAEYLGVAPSTAARVLRRLVRDGYLEAGEFSRRGRRTWAVTVQGIQLANATAAKPITRAHADTLLRDVVARMADVEAQPFAFRVTRAFVFGSYLDAAIDRLGDLDVAFELAPRLGDSNAQHALKKERIRLARAQGREFSNYSMELDWPRVEVILFLRARRRALSLLDVSENEHEHREFFHRIPHRQIYPPSGADLGR